MNIVLNRQVNQIKKGWTSRCSALGVAAHGFSPEMADRNLEIVVRRLLAPFERDGVLLKEVESLEVGVEDKGNPEVRVVVRD